MTTKSSSAMAAAREIVEEICKEIPAYDGATTKEEFDEIIKIIAKHMQIPEGQWIACSERMPEVNEFCLLYIEGTSLPVMYGYHQKKGWCSMTHGQYSEESITHWQPLPGPPKGDEPGSKP